LKGKKKRKGRGKSDRIKNSPSKRGYQQQRKIEQWNGPKLKKKKKEAKVCALKSGCERQLLISVRKGKDEFRRVRKGEDLRHGKDKRTSLLR